jgi:hypothetical protein
MKTGIFQKTALFSVFLLLLSCFGSDPGENRLIGTWKYSSYYTGSWEKIIFREDLSYRLETYNGETFQSSAINGTYRYDQEKFILEQYRNNDVAFEYAIHGDSLFTMNKVYIRQ